ncbi:MAG: hypothetical protein AB8B86_08190 [Pseudomonadales bacterium]
MTETPTPAANTVSGKVADGYLVGAVVCLDLNANKRCDADEPQAISTAGGVYDLEIPEELNPNDYLLVVEVPANAIDEDTYEEVGGEYVMTAPAGMQDFVSPITTIIQTQIESNPGMSADEAEASVKTQLGYEPEDDIDLFEDYVEAKDDENQPDSAEYERVHRIAQVAARALESNLEAVRSATEDTDLDIEQLTDEVVRMVTRDVIDQLSNISNAVDQSGEDFNADDVNEDLEGIDTTDIEQVVAGERSLSDAQVTSIVNLLRGGVNMIDSNREGHSDDIETGISIEYSYRRLGVNDTLTGIAEQEFTYNPDTDAFSLSNRFDNIRITLGESSWLMDATAGYAFELQDDGSAIVSSPLEGRFKVSGSSTNISDQSIRGFLRGERTAWAGAMPDNASFAQGSAAYRWTFTQLTPVFGLDFYEGQDGVCFQNAANGVAITLENAGGNCNFVQGPNGDPASSLEELLVETVQQNTEFPLHLHGDVTLKLVGSLENDSGTAQFISVTGEVVKEEQWETIVRGDITVLTVPMPSSLRDNVRDSQASKLIFAVQQGFVRRGTFIAAGTTDIENEWNYNDTAMQSMLDNFDPGAQQEDSTSGGPF